MNRLILLVGTGAFLGAVMRYASSGLVQRLAGSSEFPLGTLVVNVIGCFLVGFISQLVEARGLFSAELRAMVIPGFLGGLTTFSTFSNETLNLFQDGESGIGLLNVAGHVVLGLGAVWIGRTVAFMIWR